MGHNVYWQMYCDVWEYHKKYINCLEDSAGFWHKLLEDGRELARKYNNSHFINNLVVNEIKEFERVFEKTNKYITGYKGSNGSSIVTAFFDGGKQHGI